MPNNIFTIPIPKKNNEASYTSRITRGFTLEPSSSGIITVPCYSNSRVSISGIIQYRVRNSNEGGAIDVILYEVTGDYNLGDPIETLSKFTVYGDNILTFSTFIYDNQNAGMMFENIHNEIMQISLNLDLTVGYSN